MSQKNDFSGIAQLCMFQLENESKTGLPHYFQGHFVDLNTRTSFGLMGVEDVNYLENHAHSKCCLSPEDPPIYFDVTIIDFSNTTEVTYKISKTEGDYAIFKSPHISFSTTTLKTDSEAMEYLKKNFPKLIELELEECTICIGRMEFKKLSFDRNIQEEGTEHELCCSCPSKEDDTSNNEDKQLDDLDDDF